MVIGVPIAIELGKKKLSPLLSIVSKYGFVCILQGSSQARTELMQELEDARRRLKESEADRASLRTQAEKAKGTNTRKKYVSVISILLPLYN